MAGTIQAFVGPNGSGKTLAAVVEVVIPALRAGIPVVSNAMIYPSVIGCDDTLARTLASWRDIVTARHCILFLDEITACLPSRGFGGVPPELQRVLNQLRKQDVTTVWTAPNWARADVLLREVTQEVTVCRGFFNARYEIDKDGYVRDERGRKVRRRSRWPAKKLFRWVTYDAQEYDDYQDRRIIEIKPARQTWWYRSTRKPQQWVYQTMQPVGLLDHIDDVGICVICNGARQRHKCRCTHDERARAWQVEDDTGASDEDAAAADAGDVVDVLAAIGRTDDGMGRR